MGRVKLDHVEPRGLSPPCCGHPAIADPRHACGVERFGQRVAGRMLLRGWCNRRPRLEGERLLLFLGLVEGAAPRNGGGRLAPGVRKLDARRSTLGVEEFDDAAERSNLSVLPQAGIGIGDAAFGRHRCRFCDDEAEAAQREAAQMHEVPVVGMAVTCRILAHRRHHHAVLEREIAEGDGREKVGHQLSASFIR